MKVNEKKLNLAKDILINSSDIETIVAINNIKQIKKYITQIKDNKLNFIELDSFIKKCTLKYIEIIDIIQETIDRNIYLYKKDYYLKRLDCIELGIYTYILKIKGKIEDVYDIMYSIE